MHPNMYLRRYFKSSHQIHGAIEENINFIQEYTQKYIQGYILKYIKYT